MFLMLRILLVVGAIFWLSPLRDPADTDPAARVWAMLSDEERALAATLPALGPAIAGAAARVAAKPAEDPPRIRREPRREPRRGIAPDGR